MKEKKLTNIDYGIIVSLFLLFVISMVSIYATTVLMGGGNMRSTLMQLLWYALGTITIIVFMQLDSKHLWKLVPFAYGVALILLVAVLFFYDRETAATFGAKSWFRIGPLSFQPSEFSKISLILMLSKVVTEHNIRNRKRDLKTDRSLLLKIAAWTAPLLVLVMLENDLGTTLVLIAIMFGVILMSGISVKILAPLFLIIFGALALVLYLAVFHRDILAFFGVKPYQFTRIDAWLNPMSTTSSGTYQVRNAMIAIATGGIFGKGVGVTDVYVPIRESDMIFSTIAENTGLIGSLFVIFIYIALIYQMVRICLESKSEFYTYIAVGVISMIAFHVFENIGMNIGLLPLTGIPLPFISQGGSALVVNLMGVGLMLSMKYQTKAERRAHRVRKEETKHDTV